MNDEQKEWHEQYWKNSGGTREVLRFGCVFLIWQGLGIGFTIWSGNIGYMLVCLAVVFSFPSLTGYWQPAYAFSRKILGNENLPLRLMPRKFKWWGFIPLAIRLFISGVLFFKGVELLIK